MVSTLDGLEQRGLVRREAHPHDRRLRLVAVTDAGAALLEQAQRTAGELEERVLTTLPAGDRARLVPLLRALVEAAPDGSPGGSCV